jgi:hypothetical protein
MQPHNWRSDRLGGGGNVILHYPHMCGGRDRWHGSLASGGGIVISLWEGEKSSYVEFRLINELTRFKF